MRLILWDIDGTLLRAGPVAAEVFATAVEHVVGTHPGDHGVRMSGKTDPQIAREILEVMAIVEDADRHLPAIMRRLEEELADAAERLRADGRVLPGVTEILARLDAEEGVIQTVLTGNIAPNAAAKLAAMGIDGWFDLEVGSYGSDHHDRAELVPIAVDRVRRRYGSEPEAIWVVGDTPNDLACARAGGAQCLLVATGRYGYEALTGAGADHLAADLSDTDALLDLLLGQS
jgi:phosphoglycolate phosphatase